MKPIHFLLLLLLTVPCKSQENNLITTFNLKELPKITTVKLSDLGFVDIEYIPLETNEQSMISNIDLVFFNDYSINKIIPGDGYFIIKNGERVLKFSEDGSFIASIGKIGRGPDDISQIEDVEIDKTNQNIYIVSGWQKKFCLYSPGGEFIKTFNVPFYVREFRLFEDKILCYCGNNRGDNKSSFILIDKLGHIIKSFPNKYTFKPKSKFGFTHENLFYSYNNKLNVKELCSDTIFSFENMGFKPYTSIGVGKRQVTAKVRSESDADEIGENYIQPMNFLEFGAFIYYAFIYKFIQGDVRIYGFIGSKQNNFQALFNLGEGIANDIDGGPNILPLTTKNDNTIISLIDALTLKKYIITEEFKKSVPKYPDKKKELEKLANSLKETDNPVLMMVRLKK